MYSGLIVDYEDGFGMRITDKIKHDPIKRIVYRNIKEHIENNDRLTIKEKIILEIFFGVWNGFNYSSDEICRIFELSKEEFNKLLGKARGRRACRCSSRFLD